MKAQNLKNGCCPTGCKERTLRLLVYFLCLNKLTSLENSQWSTKIIRILSTQAAATFHVEEYKNEYKRVPSLMSSSETDNSALSVREIMSRVMVN